VRCSPLCHCVAVPRPVVQSSHREFMLARSVLRVIGSKYVNVEGTPAYTIESFGK
jgi:hypothetical protein